MTDRVVGAYAHHMSITCSPSGASGVKSDAVKTSHAYHMYYKYSLLHQTYRDILVHQRYTMWNEMFHQKRPVLGFLKEWHLQKLSSCGPEKNGEKYFS